MSLKSSFLPKSLADLLIGWWSVGFEYLTKHHFKHSLSQKWELGKKSDANFILTLAVAKVKYDGIPMAKILVKNLLFLVVYQWCNDAL